MQNVKYNYRLYPSKLQEQTLNQFCGAQRFIWNHFLNLEQQEYNASGKFRFKHVNITALPNLKKEIAWLNDIPSTSLQQSLIHLDDAFKKSNNKKGFPKFKRKKLFQGSFSLTMISKNLKDNYFKIPRLGDVKIKLHRELPSEFKSCQIKQKAGKWYVSFTVKVKSKRLINHAVNSIGLDFNSVDLVVDSNNNAIKNPKYFSKSKKTIKKANQQLSKKNKGSANWRKALLKLQRAHDKIYNQRHNMLHQLSHKYITKYDLICIEDLNVAGMSKFNGSMVHDAGWSKLRHMLEYKALLHGKHISVISRWFPSSKTCSECGTIHEKSLNERDHICDCGFVTTRDHNAALNILNEGIDQLIRAGTAQIYAYGDVTSGEVVFNNTSSYTSLKQEATQALA